MRKAGFL
jgi:hypothetical protein